MLIEDILSHLNLMELIIIIGGFFTLRKQIQKVKCDIYHFLKECDNDNKTDIKEELHNYLKNMKEE